MTLLKYIIFLALILPGTLLHAQGIHFGVESIIGLHYNIADGPSYKTPVGDGGGGIHISISDPYGRSSLGFNGRLTFTNDEEIYSIFPGYSKLTISFRDIVASFQLVKKINEQYRIYAGLNFSYNTINTIRQRAGGSFIDQGQSVPQLEPVIKENVRKFNAGIECGFMYDLGKGFAVGLHSNYYLMKRLEEDLDLSQHGFTNKTALNFRPIALRVQLSFDIT